MARVYERKDSPQRYWIDYTDPSGRRIRRPAGNNRKAAERVLAKVQAEVVEGTYYDRSRQKSLTIGELRDRWLEEWGRVTRAGRAKRSLASETVRWRLIVEYLGEHTPVASLTAEDCERLGRKIAETPRERKRDGETVGRSPADVNRHRALLRAALRLAGEKGYRHQNPMVGWRVIAEPRHRERTATPPEVDRLLNGEVEVRLRGGRTVTRRAAAEDMRLLIALAYGSALRLGEACDLEWTRVDLERRMVALEETKNGERRRVALPKEVAEELTRWKEAHGGEWGNRVFSPATCTENVSPRFVRLARRLGIEGLTFHDLRHSAATNLSRGGAPWPVIKRQGGWKTDAAASRYLNPDDLDLLAAVDAAVPRGGRRPPQSG